MIVTTVNSFSMAVLYKHAAAKDLIVTGLWHRAVPVGPMVGLQQLLLQDWFRSP
jgi:hypothetical protein